MFLKNVQKASVNFNDVVWLIITRLKIKNRSQIYVINRPRPRHGHKCTKYKMYLSITMVICIKQHLSNIWSSIHESWATLRPSWQKSVAYKKRVYSTFMYVFIMSYAIRENLHFAVAWMSRNSAISDIKWLKQSSNHIVCKQTLSHLAKLVEFLFTN